MLGSISKLRNKKGFTLIELIVVLAVLAIIMAIAVPRFGGVRDQAKVDADMATLASIAKLAEFEYVRLNGEITDNELSADKVKELIAANFGKKEDGGPKAIFQSEDLNGLEEELTVSFTDGYVSSIKAGDIVYTYLDGKFSPS